MDPDLLIFGKSFSSNVQVIPQMATFNTSDLSGTDKRQFNRPHMEPSSSAHPTILVTSPKTSTSTPISISPISSSPPITVYSTQDNQNTLPASAIQTSTTLEQSSQLISTRVITHPLTDPSIISTTKASPAPRSTMQPSFSFINRQTSSTPQPAYTFSTTITPSQLSSQITSSVTSFSQVGLLRTTTIGQIASTEFKTLPYLSTSTTFISQTTTTTTIPITSTLESSTVKTTAKAVPLTNTPESSMLETKTTPVPLTSMLKSSTVETTANSPPLISTLEGSTKEVTTMPIPLTTTPLNNPQETTVVTVSLSSTLQSSTKKSTTMLVPLLNALKSITGETTTSPVPFVNISQSSTGETTTMQGTSQSGIQETTTMPVPLLTIPEKRETTTTPPVSLASILQSSKRESIANITHPTVQLSSASESLASSPLPPVKTPTGYAKTLTGPQVMANIFATTGPPLIAQIPNHTASPLIGKRITPTSTTDSPSQGYTNIHLVTTDVSVNTVRPTTLNRLHTSAAASETNSGLNTSPTTPTTVEDSQPYPNDTKGYVSRNFTTGNSPQPVSDGGLTQVWHLAANTVLVALATCAALACGCCCSVLMAASWRGRRRRKGRFQTTLRGKKGSMRLIKYVFVRENS